MVDMCLSTVFYEIQAYAWPWVLPSLSNDGAIRIPTYDFLLVNNSKYMPICNILVDIATQNIHDLKFDLSKSLKFEGNAAIRKPTCDILLVNNSKYMPICSILEDIATQNMHDLEFGQGHWMSKLMVPLESPHMSSY